MPWSSLRSSCTTRWVFVVHSEIARKVLNKIVELTYDNIKEMFMPEKKVDIKNLFIRRKNMEIDPEEARKREEGRALLKELLDILHWRFWLEQCWESRLPC